MLLGLWGGGRADLGSKIWQSHCKDPSVMRKESTTEDTAFIWKKIKKDFFPMTHTKTTVEKHRWFIWFINGKLSLLAY